MRGKGFAGDFQGQFDGGIKGVAAMVFIAGELGQAFNIQQLIEQKGQIFGIDDFLGHVERSPECRRQASSDTQTAKAKPETDSGFACG